MKTTREEFKRFVEIQNSGIVNMLSPQVQSLAGISKGVHLEIMQKYNEMAELWPEESERGC